MSRNNVQTVTLPVLVSAKSARSADGWATFLSPRELMDGVSGFVREVTSEDVTRWLRTELTARDSKIFIGLSKLQWAHEENDEFTSRQAHEVLQHHVQDLAPWGAPTLVIDTKKGTARLTRDNHLTDWNAARWNYSGLITERFKDARLVMWHSEKQDRFLPALYCTNKMSAIFVMRFLVKSVFICPKCDAPFVPAASNVDYCTTAHGESYRMARSRWWAKQRKLQPPAKPGGRTRA